MESISYHIPSNVINLFVQEALKNVGANGKHLETLALLIGRKENNRIIAEEIIFPRQTGHDSNVDDNGELTIFVINATFSNRFVNNNFFKFTFYVIFESVTKQYY